MFKDDEALAQLQNIENSAGNIERNDALNKIEALRKDLINSINEVLK